MCALRDLMISAFIPFIRNLLERWKQLNEYCGIHLSRLYMHFLHYLIFVLSCHPRAKKNAVFCFQKYVNAEKRAAFRIKIIYKHHPDPP